MQKKIDLLTRPHKDQRKWMYSLSIQASELDFNDTHQSKSFRTALKALMEDLKEHAENEELFILPLIASQFPKEASVFQHDHPEIEIKIQALLDTMEELTQSTIPDKSDLGLTFYRLFNQFIGNYLLHLDAEEQKILPIFEEHFSAEELIGVMITFKTFREGDKPDQVKQFIKSMVNSLDVSALKELFASIKKHAPDGLFTPICNLSKEVIEPALWLQIEKHNFER